VVQAMGWANACRSKSAVHLAREILLLGVEPAVGTRSCNPNEVVWPVAAVDVSQNTDPFATALATWHRRVGSMQACSPKKESAGKTHAHANLTIT
jgi:hypothetical protein